MLTYTPPTEDMAFLLFDVFDVDSQWANSAELREVDKELATAVLAEAAKLAEDLLPLYQESDAGARWRDGAVTAPAGFREAFAELAGGGWFGVRGNPEYGGQGLPTAITVLLEEMFWGANTNLYLYGALTTGAALCIDAHADEATKKAFLPQLYSGNWTGAMALTEAHAGTDLGLIRTKATPTADGAYAIAGTKIFITSGEHDLAENIVHLVLAKLPDAPAGNRGISLFLVPKMLPDGTRNAFASGAIEHKMGIRGSATSVINYEDAKGWLIGEPNQGLAAMFTMMNHARLSVGIQGLGLTELALQSATAYARERLQGRAPSGPVNPDGPADSILVHPDVRRMLLTQRAFAEGGRALGVYVAALLDQAKYATNAGERETAQRRVDLLTPVVKAFLTDRGMECVLLAQQVFGGHGYIVEHGIEQVVRDMRITQIYEGANGIQALDFAARKVLRDGGAALRELLEDMRREVGDDEFSAPLAAALETVRRSAEGLGAGARQDPDLAGAVATDFLELTGLTVFAWLWAKMARAAAAESANSGTQLNKRETARFFYAKLLPKTVALEQTIKAGAESVMALPLEAF